MIYSWKKETEFRSNVIVSHIRCKQIRLILQNQKHSYLRFKILQFSWPKKRWLYRPRGRVLKKLEGPLGLVGVRGSLQEIYEVRLVNEHYQGEGEKKSRLQYVTEYRVFTLSIWKKTCTCVTGKGSRHALLFDSQATDQAYSLIFFGTFIYVLPRIGTQSLQHPTRPQACTGMTHLMMWKPSRQQHPRLLYYIKDVASWHHFQYAIANP